MRRGGHQKQAGFTLVEAMVATLVITVGFVGSYTLVGYTQDAVQSASIRQKLQMQANQILDLIEADLEHVDSYDNLDLENCAAPDVGVTDTWILRRYEWCRRLTDDARAVQANDTRSVDVTTLADGSKAVQVLLESGNGSMQIVMKRVYVP